MECQRKSYKQNLHQPVLEASQRLDNLDKITMGRMNEWEWGIASRLCKTVVDSLCLFKMCSVIFFFFPTKAKIQSPTFFPSSFEKKVWTKRRRETMFCRNGALQFSHNLTAQYVHYLRICFLRAARIFNLFSKCMKDLLNALP